MDNISILFDKYNEAFDIIKDRFDLLYKEFSVLGEDNPIEHIKYRIKKLDSIEKKMIKLSVPLTCENIENTLSDIIGVRIVCSFLDDLEVIKNVIRKMEESGELSIIGEKDYVNNPKESGYSSYHMIVEIPLKIGEELIKVKTEIQIRTIAMDMHASLEHKLRYKKEHDSGIYDEALRETFEICRRIDKDLNSFIRENKYQKERDLFKVSSFMNDNEYRVFKLKYEAALNKIRIKINNLCAMYEKNGQVNPIEHIKYRIKDDEQIVRKLLADNKSINLENIRGYVNDLAGIRIVCSFNSDLEELIEIIKSDPELVIINEKDYVNSSKDSGYRGYHLIVGVPVYLSSGLTMIKVEIQIRTIAMEMWASLEQKICYHKETTDEARSELKRLAGIISIIDNNINEIVEYSRGINNNVKKLERKKNNS